MDYARQYQRIHRTPGLMEAIRTITLDTNGGPQVTEVMAGWCIPIWLAGVQLKRLPPPKRVLIRLVQREILLRIEQAFTELESKTTTPPPPSEASAPQSVWREGHAFFDHLEAEFGGLPREVQEVRQERQETRSHLAAMAHDLEDLKERVTILEGGPARPVIGVSPQRLAQLYLLANRVRQRYGYGTAKTLEALVAHVQVEDVYDLPESAWPAILDWFASLLEN